MATKMDSTTWNEATPKLTSAFWYKNGTTSGPGTGVLGRDDAGDASRVGSVAFEKLRSRVRVWLYERDRLATAAVAAFTVAVLSASAPSRPGNSSPKKPCSFLKPPRVALLFLDPVLLAVVMLATDGRRSSLNDSASGESMLLLLPPPGAIRLLFCSGWVLLLLPPPGRCAGDACALDRLSLESL
jgi:hypothetical protein